MLQNSKIEESISNFFLKRFVQELIYQAGEIKRAKIPIDKEKILKKLVEIEKKDFISQKVEKSEKEYHKNLENNDNSEKVNKKIENTNNISALNSIKLNNNSRNFHPRFIPMRRPLSKFPINNQRKNQIQINNSPLQKSINSNNIPIVNPSPAMFQKTEAFNMSKLNGLLSDSSVQLIECQGQGKPVLVHKSGIIQNTSLTLNNEEINTIMKEISEKTKIPLISGVFKAALGDLIVTAVVSEFVGTRFILQKKPKQMPQPN